MKSYKFTLVPNSRVAMRKVYFGTYKEYKKIVDKYYDLRYSVPFTQEQLDTQLYHLPPGQQIPEHTGSVLYPTLLIEWDTDIEVAVEVFETMSKMQKPIEDIDFNSYESQSQQAALQLYRDSSRLV